MIQDTEHQGVEKVRSLAQWCTIKISHTHIEVLCICRSTMFLSDPDDNIGTVLNEVSFDMVYIQYCGSSGICSARLLTVPDDSPCGQDHRG